LVHGKEGYEVEFVTLEGETNAVVSLRANQLCAVEPREIALARAVGKCRPWIVGGKSNGNLARMDELSMPTEREKMLPGAVSFAPSSPCLCVLCG
jgi:hypothetical protein